MKKLTKENIKLIDEFLIKNKVKFIDVRLELIDHLASDFENQLYQGSLERFLDTQKDFVEEFIKKRQKTIHWSYQRQLWRRFLMFFNKTDYLAYTLLIGVVLYFLIYGLSQKSNLILFGLTLLTPLFIAVFYQFKHSKPFKKIQSAQSVFSIMALPSLFLYVFNPLADFLLANNYAFMVYWFLAFLFNVSGLIEVYKRKNEIIDKYINCVND